MSDGSCDLNDSGDDYRGSPMKKPKPTSSTTKTGLSNFADNLYHSRTTSSTKEILFASTQASSDTLMHKVLCHEYIRLVHFVIIFFSLLFLL